MTTWRRSRAIRVAVFVLATAGFSGFCTDEIGEAPGITGVGGDAFGRDVTADLREALDRAIQDEYQAEVIYTRVIEDFGEIVPFSSIVLAEGTHIAALAHLYDNRGLDVPGSTTLLEDVASFPTLSEACAASAAEEVLNVAMYEELLAADLPNDVRNVFENLQAASRDHHLPAFDRCR